MLITLLLLGTKLLVAPAIIGAGIAAGASLLGTGATVYAGGKTNKKTREWNEKMYGIQRADALADYEMQNKYNSPEQQMQRLKEAGLNPNLVYGNGATATGGSVRSTDVKSWSPSAPNFTGIGTAAAQGLAAYHDISLQQESVKNMVAQRRNMELDSALKTIKVSTDGIKNAQTDLDLQRSRDLYDTSIATANAKLASINASTDVKVSKEIRDAAMHAPTLAAAIQKVANMSAQEDLAKQQLANLQRSGILQKMEIDMRKLGLSFNDSVILRMLAQFAEGKSLPDLVKTAWNDLTTIAGDKGKEFMFNDKDNKHSVLGGMFSIDKPDLSNIPRKKR